MSFFRLDKPVQFLKGVGPVRAEALGGRGGRPTGELKASELYLPSGTYENMDPYIWALPVLSQLDDLWIRLLVCEL